MPQKVFSHHTLELMRSALPYMHPRMQKSVEVMSKVEELIDMVQSPSPSGDLSAMSVQSNAPANMEEILLQIKSVGNKREQEVIDHITSLLKMQKMLQNYRSFMNTKSETVSGNGSLQASGSQDSLMEFLLSQLTQEQKSSFENISSVLHSKNS